MNRRRLALYTRRSSRRHRPLHNLMTLIILGTIIGGLVSLVEQVGWSAAPPPVAVASQPTAQAALPTARPTDMPLALPVAVPARRAPMAILAPTAGIHAGVVEVYLNGLSWDVSRLGSNAGHLQGTAAFGKPGNLVLAGHVEMADGRPGVFARIDSLGQGDLLVLSRGTEQKRYAVSAVKTVAPDDLSVLYPTSTDQLTLITCGDYDLFHNVYRERIVVIAERSA